MIAALAMSEDKTQVTVDRCTESVENLVRMITAGVIARPRNRNRAAIVTEIGWHVVKIRNERFGL